MLTTRSRNVRPNFDIHHDDAGGSTDEEPQEMEESEMKDEEESDDDGLSEASEESDDAVDPAVAEDITKFQQSFQGITDRYRLIKRIGEGKLDCLSLGQWVNGTDAAQEHFLRFTRQRTYCMMASSTTGTLTKRRTKAGRNGHRRSLLRKTVWVHHLTNRITHGGGLGRNMSPSRRFMSLAALLES